MEPLTVLKKGGVRHLALIDGTKRVGPTFKGLFGREVTLVGGAKIVADEAYLRESILKPNAKVSQGFPPAMPPAMLKATDVDDVVAFLKTLK